MFAQTMLPCAEILSFAIVSNDGKSDVRNVHTETWLTVNDYPEGDGPENTACGGIPFRQGVLFGERDIKLLSGEAEIPIAVKSLAYWPDNSVRVMLIQFSAEFAGESKKYMLKIGTPRGESDVPLIPVIPIPLFHCALVFEPNNGILHHPHPNLPPSRWKGFRA